MKIIYFDYWTKGIHNFIAINESLKKLGHETMLLHIGSFRETCKEKDEIKNITCVDISFFGTIYIHKALQIVKPDVVLSLNTTGILDRSLILSCRKMGIRTVYLMHGASPLGDSLEQYIEIKKKYHKSIIVKVKKIKHYFQFVIPNYLYTLWQVDKRKIYSLSFLNVLYRYFRNPALSQFYPIHTEELIHDNGLIYSNAYKDFYKKLGYEDSKLKVVGCPQYDDLFYKVTHNEFDLDDLPNKVIETIQVGKKYVVYLEEGFVENGNFGGWTNDYRNDHLTQIANRLEKEGIFLIVKLHPQVSFNNVRIESNNVFVIDKADMNSLIYYSYFCIVHFSTTINIPIICNKPILIPTWGKSKNMPTSHFIESGVANEWVAVNEPLKLNIDSNARGKYIEEFITITEPVAKNNIIKNILD